MPLRVRVRSRRTKFVSPHDELGLAQLSSNPFLTTLAARMLACGMLRDHVHLATALDSSLPWGRVSA